MRGSPQKNGLLSVGGDLIKVTDLATLSLMDLRMVLSQKGLAWLSTSPHFLFWL